MSNNLKEKISIIIRKFEYEKFEEVIIITYIKKR